MDDAKKKYIYLTVSVILILIFILSRLFFSKQIEFEDKNLQKAIASFSQKEIKNTTELDLRYLEIQSIKGLEKLSKLEKLNLEGNNIEDYSPLLKLSIKEINLNNSNLKQIPELPNCMEYLYLNNNDISELSQLKHYNLNNLKALSVANNKISDLSAIKTLTKLESLQLNDNNIRNIEPIAYLKRLKSLNFSNNQIKDISVLQELSNLQELYLYGNKISNISALKELPLKWIYLEKNQLNLHEDSEAMKVIESFKSKRTIIHYQIQDPELESDENLILIRINGELLQSDVDPIIQNGRTLVPLRAIFEALDIDVEWIEETRTIIGSKEKNSIVLQIDNIKAAVNNEEISLDTAAIIVDGRTLVPVRFIAEATGRKVSWREASYEEANRIVDIIDD